MSTTSDGRKAVSTSSKVLQIWDLETGGSPKEIEDHKEPVYSVSLITPLRIWLYERKWNNGRWDDNIKVTCQWCGKRFPVAGKILDVITAINRNANLSPDQPPCLELPDEAWEEPRAFSPNARFVISRSNSTLSSWIIETDIESEDSRQYAKTEEN